MGGYIPSPLFCSHLNVSLSLNLTWFKDLCGPKKTDRKSERSHTV